MPSTRHQASNKRRWSAIVCLLGSLLFLGLVIALIDLATTVYADSDISDVSDAPQRNVALVLGCTPTLADGRRNLYFDYRMNKAAELWRSQKVEYLLVSGDNGTDAYDETTAMKVALVSRGVPAKNIIGDYAGFRTLDSVVRAKEVFGQDSALVVSQKFHNERAIILGRRFGIELHGVNAEDVALRAAFKTRVRETLARVKMVIDIVLGTAPRFLGPVVGIPSEGSQ